MLGIWGYLAPLASPGYAYARAVEQIAAAGWIAIEWTTEWKKLHCPHNWNVEFRGGLWKKKMQERWSFLGKLAAHARSKDKLGMVRGPSYGGGVLIHASERGQSSVHGNFDQATIWKKIFVRIRRRPRKPPTRRSTLGFLQFLRMTWYRVQSPQGTNYFGALSARPCRMHLSIFSHAAFDHELRRKTQPSHLHRAARSVSFVIAECCRKSGGFVYRRSDLWWKI